MNPYGRIVERIIPGAVPIEVYLWHIGRYIFASKFISPEDIILDVACGVGYGVYLLAMKGTRKVIGIDISKDAIDYAKRSYQNASNNVEFLVGDATNMPINSSEIDTLISFETIEHLKDPDTFLMECRRVLKDNGTLILSTPNKYASLKKYVENPYHLNELFIEEIIDKVISLEFEITGIYGQRPLEILSENKNMNKRFISVVSRLMPQFIKKRIFSFYYLPKKTGISRKMIKIYQNNPKKFEEFVVNSEINYRYLPHQISDIESNKYKFDIFLIVAKKV